MRKKPCGLEIKPSSPFIDEMTLLVDMFILKVYTNKSVTQPVSNIAALSFKN